MICAPGSGSKSKLPNAVRRTDARVKSVANAGRSRNSVSPLWSSPVMMLKGAPDEAMINGKKPTPQRVSNDPVSVKRCRTSNDVLPNSSLRSYEFAGNVPGPSVSPLALPNV